jgi:hypothetical protein
MYDRCKYCQEDKLHWHFNILTKKYELLDARDSKHRCRPNKNLRNKQEKHLSKDDNSKSQAWKDLKARLDKEGAKVYIIKK